VLRARVMEPSGQTGNGQRWAGRRLVLPSPPLLPRLRVAPRPRPRRHRHQPRPTSARCPSDAETIQHLHSTLRALPRPLLESLTRAFRKRFQVPEAAATIADRINQKCHHDWIETFLVSHREVRSAEQHREVRSAEQHQRPGDR
jgi:hypothetical protein